MKTKDSTRWSLPPTPRQTRALVLMGVQDKDLPTTRGTARDLIYKLRKEKEVKQNGLDRGR